MEMALLCLPLALLSPKANKQDDTCGMLSLAHALTKHSNGH